MKSIISFVLGILFVATMSFTSVAPPASNITYTALRESPSFDAEFKSIISQVTADVHDANWEQGYQSTNTREGRRIVFANKILNEDSRTIEKIKQYLITPKFSYTLSDDVQMRAEIRDNFTNAFDSLAGAY